MNEDAMCVGTPSCLNEMPTIQNEIRRRRENIQREMNDLDNIEKYIQENPGFGAVLESLRRVGIR